MRPGGEDPYGECMSHFVLRKLIKYRGGSCNARALTAKLISTVKSTETFRHATARARLRMGEVRPSRDMRWRGLAPFPSRAAASSAAAAAAMSRRAEPGGAYVTNVLSSLTTGWAPTLGTRARDTTRAWLNTGLRRRQRGLVEHWPRRGLP